MAKKTGVPGEIPKKLAYKKLPKDIEELIEDEERAKVTKDVKITKDAKDQYIVRFPKKISEEMEITSEDRIRFKLTLPKPRSDESPRLMINLIKNEA